MASESGASERIGAGMGARETSNRQRYLTALFGLDAVIRRVPTTAWDSPSPCEGWSARDVVDHNLFIIRMVRGMAGGQDAVVPRTEDDGLFPAPVDGYSLAAWLPFTTFGPGDDPVAVWSHHFRELATALDIVDPPTVAVRSLFGHETLDEYLAWAFFDPLVHTWDVATATGLPPVVDEDLATEALDYISAHEATLRRPMVLGDPVQTNSEDPLERLLAFCGRRLDPES